MSRVRLGSHTRDLVEELRRYGLKPTVEHTNGGHIRLRWHDGTRTGSYVIGMSPSDHRAFLNARAGIRRILRGAHCKEYRT
jgi:hypothetical protein